MKKRLLSVAFLMSGVFMAHAQIGIGTLNPNDSSMMEVASSNKGILIPRIALTSTTDATTITSGNINSLLVFNTTSNDQLQPGYYYWFDNAWKKLAITDEINQETITTLSVLDAAVYEYISENGTSTTINVPADVIQNFTTITQDQTVLNHLIQIIQNHAGNVYYDGTTFTYLDENQNVQTINLQQLVQAHQTLTSLTYDPLTSQLTYTDENGIAHVHVLNNTRNQGMAIVNNELILTDTDGETVTVDLSAYLDNTDDQAITDFSITNNVLSITLEDGGTQTVDLSYLLNSTNLEAGTNVTIGGIGTVDDPYVISSENTRNESMSIIDNILTLTDSDGATVDINLSAYLDNTDEQDIVDFFLNENNELTITIENGNTQVVNLNPLVTHIEEGANVTITGNGTAANPYVITPHKTIVTGGVNVVVAPQEDGITTNYTISVPTATPTTPGVVKQAETAPTVLISSEGELSINFDALSDFKEVNTDYQATVQDFVVFGNATADTILITLPTPVGNKGKKLTIKKSDVNEYAYVNVTSTVGSIEGITELYTSLPYSGWDLMSDGQIWRIVNKF